jgi:hypothetical protein
MYRNNIENVNLLKDRINSLGDTLYIFEDSAAFVETELNVQETYDKISQNDFETASILILTINNLPFGFWGRMPVEVWNWLNEKSLKNSDTMVSTYIQELTRLTEQNSKLTTELEKTKSDYEEVQKALQIQMQQIGILEKKLKETLS